MRKMRKLLCLIAFFVAASPFAATAQTPQGSPPGHGLTLADADWATQDMAAFSTATPGRVSGGGRVGRSYSRADYQPHMAQALANAYANAYPRPAPPAAGRWPRAFRHASVTLTNDGAKTVESVRLDFVFTDPATGAEVNRIHHRSKKRLRPGEAATTKKEVMASSRHKRGDGAAVSVEVTEVVYADGTAWWP